MSATTKICPHRTTCAMYSQFQLDLSVRVWETFFCSRRYTDCARFKLTEAGSPVPLTLLPNGNHLTAALGSVPAPQADPDPVPDAVAEAAAAGTKPPPAHETAPSAAPSGYSYYLRMPVLGSGGLRDAIGDALKQAGVSIDAYVERAGGTGSAQVIVLTAEVEESRIDRAVTQLSALEPVTGEIVRIRLESLGAGAAS
ncbi:MAG: hypothetical protein LJE84_12825 [Gammaproteobacteria bacterium]|nr:hypothetical protein [Gammaproteobacteria bacterium]